MARVGFEPRPCWSRARRFNHSTTLPTLYKSNKSFIRITIFCFKKLQFSNVSTFLANDLRQVFHDCQRVCLLLALTSLFFVEIVFAANVLNRINKEFDFSLNFLKY